MDEKYAQRIKDECSDGFDYEANGCNLDAIMMDLLKELGLSETAKAFENVDCWRA